MPKKAAQVAALEARIERLEKTVNDLTKSLNQHIDITELAFTQLSVLALAVQTLQRKDKET